MRLAAEWTPGRLILDLESDCKMMIKYLQQEEAQRSVNTFIIQEMLEASKQVQSVHFTHVKREQNVIANELAQLAKHLNHSAVWRERAPACVEKLVAQDCNQISSNE